MDEICAHYSDDHQYGDWYRLEEEFVVEGSNFALDGATAYSMASRSDGLTRSSSNGSEASVDWCTCPNGPAAVKLMNTIMHCELPENWFNDLYFQLGLSSELTCREASVEASCGEVLDNVPEVPVASTERGDK